MKIVVTGATGFIGRPLCAELLKQRHSVVALSRDAERARKALGPGIECVTWGKQSDAWKRAVAECDTVVNLAGESIAGRKWTPEYKQKIVSSRVETTRTLVQAISASERKPAAFICTSAVGYYGDCGEKVVTEETPPSQDFLGTLCLQWEAEAQKAADCGLREARMRVGIVLGKGNDSALEKMLYPLPLPISPWKLGLGGPLGNGKQYMPWVHLDDVVEMFAWAATNPEVRGPVNVTAPLPVTNAEFSRSLGRALHRPGVLPVPAFALKLALGEFAGFLLAGQKALPTVAEKLGYHFKFPDLDSALRVLLA